MPPPWTTRAEEIADEFHRRMQRHQVFNEYFLEYMSQARIAADRQAIRDHLLRQAPPQGLRAMVGRVLAGGLFGPRRREGTANDVDADDGLYVLTDSNDEDAALFTLQKEKRP